MKREFILFVLLAGVAFPAAAQSAPEQAQRGRLNRLTQLVNSAADGVFRPIELGPDHRVMQKLTESQGEDGFLKTASNSYVELAAGMHVWSELDQKWINASDEIEIQPGRATAARAQLRPTFLADLSDNVLTSERAG